MKTTKTRAERAAELEAQAKASDMRAANAADWKERKAWREDAAQLRADASDLRAGEEPWRCPFERKWRRAG
jgi:hypothetical protein